jgi:hypothetical protein
MMMAAIPLSGFTPLLIALLLLGKGELASQQRHCDAALRSGYEGLWSRMPSRGQVKPDSMSFAGMQGRLAGQYLLLEVMTEGAGRRKWVRESRLAIVLRSPVDTSRRIGYVRNVIAVGRAIIEREGELHGSVPRIRSSRPIWFRVSYDPPNRLALFAVSDSASLDILGNDSPGPELRVLDIGFDGKLYGRWEATGIEAVSFPSPVGELVEREQGYFCAWPIK